MTAAERPLLDIRNEAEAGIDDDEELTRMLRKLEEGTDRRRTWRWFALGGAVVLAVLVAVLWPVMAGRLAATKQLDQAEALLGKARGAVAGVDEVVRVQLSAEQAEAVPDVNPAILVARRDLKQTLLLLAEATPRLSERERRRGELIRTSAQARLVMVDRAPAILRASIKAVRAKNLADAGWLRSRNAEGFESRANAAYSKQTARGVRSAADLFARAAGSLLLAKPLYSRAASAFPDADFARYAVYADQRIAALRTAESGTAAWLGGDIATANALRSAYSARSAKAAHTLKTLPSAPGRATGEAFTRVAGRALGAYVKARAQAGDADKALKSQ